MIDSLLTRINKLRLYLGQKELLPNEKGETWLRDLPFRHNGLYEEHATYIKEGQGHKVIREYSPHNGNMITQSDTLMSHQELHKYLSMIEKLTTEQVEKQVDQELRAKAIKQRMLELGL